MDSLTLGLKAFKAPPDLPFAIVLITSQGLKPTICLALCFMILLLQLKNSLWCNCTSYSLKEVYEGKYTEMTAWCAAAVKTHI